MMNYITSYTERRRLFWSALAVAVVLPLAGCSDILDVTDPDIVTPPSLESDIGLQTLRNGALGEFTVGYSGGGQADAIIMLGGLMTDEWMHSGTFPTRFRVETRNIDLDNGTLQGMFRRLQRARVSLESVTARLEQAAEGAADDRIGEMYYYAGMTYIAFAENFCNGVPFSLQPETGDTEFGAPETGSQILDRAAARFTSALGAAGVSSTIANAARVGLGRVELNRGNFSAAAAAVTSVPDNFVLMSFHSSNSADQRNSVFEFNRNAGRWSLGDLKGINGLNFRTADDPRITSALCPGCAFDKSEQVPGTDALTDNWLYFNYTSRDDPVPLATGIEARLIEAEALLASNPAGWLAELNDLRADWSSLASVVGGDDSGTLPALAMPVGATAQEDLHFRERAFWLFSTGHRLGDLRRLIRQYGRSSESVFPTGTYWKPGASYGVDVNLPVTVDEENNPSFTGCLDRNA